MSTADANTRSRHAARVELQKWCDADTTAQLMDGLRKAGLDIADLSTAGGSRR